MRNKKNMTESGNNNKLIGLKPSATLLLLPIETEKLLKMLPLTENGLKEKSKTHTTILIGLPTDLKLSTTNLSNLISLDVKLTNSSSNNLKNMKMLLLLLKFLELNLIELKPQVKLQYSLKQVQPSATNLLNTNIFSKLMP